MPLKKRLVSNGNNTSKASATTITRIKGALCCPLRDTSDPSKMFQSIEVITPLGSCGAWGAWDVFFIGAEIIVVKSKSGS